MADFVNDYEAGTITFNNSWLKAENSIDTYPLLKAEYIGEYTYMNEALKKGDIIWVHKDPSPFAEKDVWHWYRDAHSVFSVREANLKFISPNS